MFFSLCRLAGNSVRETSSHRVSGCFQSSLRPCECAHHENRRANTQRNTYLRLQPRLPPLTVKSSNDKRQERGGQRSDTFTGDIRGMHKNLILWDGLLPSQLSRGRHGDVPSQAHLCDTAGGRKEASPWCISSSSIRHTQAEGYSGL